MGQVNQGDLQFVGMWGVAPIQCEGFLCSVVFLTAKGSGSLGETKAATEAFLAPLPVYAVPPLRQRMPLYTMAKLFIQPFQKKFEILPNPSQNLFNDCFQ